MHKASSELSRSLGAISNTLSLEMTSATGFIISLSKRNEIKISKFVWLSSSWNSERLPIHLMSRAVIAEAVLKNILYFFDIMQKLLFSVCFHKHSFPQGSYSLRKISELTKIDRRVMSTHMISK